MREIIELHSKKEIPPFRRNAKGHIGRLDAPISRDPIFQEIFTSELGERKKPGEIFNLSL
jgi:hypothetical protein